MSGHDVAARARELELHFFSLMSRANQPDIVYDDEGPRWGDTYTQAESPSLQADVDAAEAKLYAHLIGHRTELESDQRWALYYASFDGPETEQQDLEVER
jgi:hypothetical protein